MRARNSSTRAGPSIFRHQPGPGVAQGLAVLLVVPGRALLRGRLPGQRAEHLVHRDPLGLGQLAHQLDQDRDGGDVLDLGQGQGGPLADRRAGSVSRLAMAGRVSGWSVRARASTAAARWIATSLSIALSKAGSAFPSG